MVVAPLRGYSSSGGPRAGIFSPITEEKHWLTKVKATASIAFFKKTLIDIFIKDIKF